MQLYFVSQKVVAIENVIGNVCLHKLCESSQRILGEGSVPEVVFLAGLDGIEVHWALGGKKPLKLRVEIEQFLRQQRSFPAAKSGIFNRALGRKTRKVLDTTGGWGGDALLMCSQGYQVEILERDPAMAAVLEDAMSRIKQSQWANKNRVTVPSVKNIDAALYLRNCEEHFDCVYLDPMFPEKPKMSAATNKYMQFLRYWLSDDQGATELAQAGERSRVKRVVIKRPHYAPPLIANPTTRFSGKLVHYDVYLKP